MLEPSGGIACLADRRVRADGRRVGAAVPRVDQDSLPMAPVRAGQPAIPTGRPQAGRISPEFRQSLPGP